MTIESEKNAPTARATLADAQPGGRLKDQALSTSEGARRYVADFFATQLRRHDFGDYILTDLAADFACTLAQHLAAQPSLGGQDAQRIIVRVAGVGQCTLTVNDGAIDIPAETIAGLAARQPVEATEQSYNSGGIELTACQLHEALLMAGNPELDVPFEDRSLVRIFWTETGHSGSGLYCECVGAEEEGCILLDGTAPAIGRPAQAVDLDAMHAAACAAWDKHQQACRITTVSGSLRKVCEALIDSQAVQS